MFKYLKIVMACWKYYKVCRVEPTTICELGDPSPPSDATLVTERICSISTIKLW